MFLGMVARPLMAKVKHTTGIKKLPENVVPNLREVLIGLYSQTLNQAKKLPEYFLYRDYLEKRMNHRLKVCQLEEDVGSISIQISFPPLQGEELIEEARFELSEISGLVADWHSCRYESPPYLSLSSKTTMFLGLDEEPSERELLIKLYYQALDVVRKVPENNKLRMFAESSISRKLEAIRWEDDWELIKSKLDYEDPIQKAQEELDHWSLFFGPDAHPNRQYPHVPRTKEFCERFDAWRREHASPDMANLPLSHDLQP